MPTIITTKLLSTLTPKEKTSRRKMNTVDDTHRSTSAVAVTKAGLAPYSRNVVVAPKDAPISKSSAERQVFILVPPTQFARSVPDGS